jgi:hypothetical protein
MGKPMESDAYNNNASNNYSIEDIHDSSNDVVNITKQEEGSKVIGNDNTTDSTYTSSAHISVLQSCKTDEDYHNDPSLSRTSECLRNHQEAYEARKAKGKDKET